MELCAPATDFSTVTCMDKFSATAATETTHTADTSPRALWGVLEVPRDLRFMAAVRISDPDARTELGKLKAALARQAAGSKVGEALLSLGDHVTEESAEGKQQRRTAGLVPVLLSDLDPTAADQLLAYVGLVKGVLVALIPSSAIEGNLPPHPTDRTRQERNGSTELILEAVGSLPELEALAVPRLDRVIRTIAYQGLILSRLRERDVRLWDESGIRDLTNHGQMLMANIEATSKGDGDAITRKQNVLGGRLSALAPGDGFSSRDFNYNTCPPGYGPTWRDEPSGARVAVKGSIEPQVHLAPAIQEMWTLFGSGATRTAIGKAMAQKGWLLRDGTGRSLADLEPAGLVAAVSRLVKAENAVLHKTGEWVQERSTGAPVNAAGGMDLRRRQDGRRSAVVKGRLAVPLVDGLPWGVSQEVWAQVEERLRQERLQGPADHGAMRRSHVLHTTQPHWSGGVGTRLIKEHESLQLRALDGQKDDRWRPSASRLLASCSYVRAVRGLGGGLAVALAQLALGQVPLSVPELLPSARLTQLTERATSLRGEAASAAAAAKAEGRAADLALGEQLESVAAARLRAQNDQLVRQARAEQSLQEVLDELQREQMQPSSATVDLASPLDVAGALMRWDGEPDEALFAAVRALELTKELVGTYVPDTDSIRLRAVARVALVDGPPARLAVEVDVPNTSSVARHEDRTSLLVAAWGRGSTLTALAEAHALTPAVVRRSLRGWLAERGVVTMATALLDCPVPVTWQAVLSALDCRLVPAPTTVSPATLAHLRAPYLDDRGGSWKSWVGSPQAEAHRLLAALQAAGGEADMAVLDEVARGDVQHLRPQGGRPALLVAPGVALRRLRPCPHEDCASPWVSRVLYVPETAAYGCVCAACGRLPDLQLADVQLPPEYRRKWERESTPDGLRTRPSRPDELRLHCTALLRCGPLVRSGEAARVLEVTASGFYGLRRGGMLPASVTVQRVELWDRNELADLAGLRRAAPIKGIKDGLLSPAQAARRLGVPEHRVREYVRDGRLAHRTLGQGAAARTRLRPEVVAAFSPPAGDLLVAMTLEEAAAAVDVPPSQVRAATKSGALSTVLTSASKLRVLPTALRAWRALQPAQPKKSATVPLPGAGITSTEQRLSVTAAAALLGLSAKQVRRLADRGLLNDHRHGGPGWRWFCPAEVLAYKATMVRQP